MLRKDQIVCQVTIADTLDMVSDIIHNPDEAEEFVKEHLHRLEGHLERSAEICIQRFTNDNL